MADSTKTGDGLDPHPGLTKTFMQERKLENAVREEDKKAQEAALKGEKPAAAAPKPAGNQTGADTSGLTEIQKQLGEFQKSVVTQMTEMQTKFDAALADKDAKLNDVLADNKRYRDRLRANKEGEGSEDPPRGDDLAAEMTAELQKMQQAFDDKLNKTLGPILEQTQNNAIAMGISNLQATDPHVKGIMEAMTPEDRAGLFDDVKTFLTGYKAKPGENPIAKAVKFAAYERGYVPKAPDGTATLLPDGSTGETKTMDETEAANRAIFGDAIFQH